MTLPILPIYAYKLPSSGEIARSVQAYVADRVEDLVKDLPKDPKLRVSTTPIDDYTQVMIFASREEIKTLIEENTEQINQELRAMGIRTAFYVKIAWTGVS